MKKDPTPPASQPHFQQEAFQAIMIPIRRLFLLLVLVCLLAPSPGQAGKLRLLSDPETIQLLEELGKPLLAAAGLPADQVHFHVILDPQLNAFALPNKDIVFHSGLLLAAETPYELSGVMAHEIAHLSAGHHDQLEQQVKGISVRSMILGAIGIGAGILTGDGTITQAGLMGSQAAGVSEILAVIREKEAQADRLAITYLNQSGYDPMGMADFLERIRRVQRLSSLAPPYLQTHPLSSTRVMEARDQAKELPKPTNPLTVAGTRLERVRAKLTAGNSADPAVPVERFQKVLQRNPGDTASRYGLAVAQRYAGLIPEADENLTLLTKTLGEDPFLLRERGLVHLEAGRVKEAEAAFRRAVALAPEVADLQYRLAFTLAEAKNYQEASRILRKLTTTKPDDPDPFYLLGVVEGKAGNLGTSHLALARSYKLDMKEKSAIWHYKRAVEYFPPGSNERDLAQRELTDMMTKEKDIWRLFRRGGGEEEEEPEKERRPRHSKPQRPPSGDRP